MCHIISQTCAIVSHIDLFHLMHTQHRVNWQIHVKTPNQLLNSLPTSIFWLKTGFSLSLYSIYCIIHSSTTCPIKQYGYSPLWIFYAQPDFPYLAFVFSKGTKPTYNFSPNSSILSRLLKIPVWHLMSIYYIWLLLFVPFSYRWRSISSIQA